MNIHEYIKMSEVTTSTIPNYQPRKLISKHQFHRIPNVLRREGCLTLPVVIVK